MSFSLYGECVWKGEGGLQTQTSHLISEKMEFVQWYAQLCFSLVFVSHIQIWPGSKILRRVCAYWFALRGILEATVEGKMSVNHLLSRTRQKRLMGESTTGILFSLWTLLLASLSQSKKITDSRRRGIFICIFPDSDRSNRDGLYKGIFCSTYALIVLDICCIWRFEICFHIHNMWSVHNLQKCLQANMLLKVHYGKKITEH